MSLEDFCQRAHVHQEVEETDGSKHNLHPTRREGIESRELDMQGLPGNLSVTSRRLLKNLIFEESETRQRIC